MDKEPRIYRRLVEAKNRKVDSSKPILTRLKSRKNIDTSELVRYRNILDLIHGGNDFLPRLKKLEEIARKNDVLDRNDLKTLQDAIKLLDKGMVPMSMAKDLAVSEDDGLSFD